MDNIKKIKEGLVSREEAASLLDCHVNTLDRLVKNGTIRAVRLGGKVLIEVASIEHALKGGAQ